MALGIFFNEMFISLNAFKRKMPTITVKNPQASPRIFRKSILKNSWNSIAEPIMTHEVNKT